MNEAADGAGPNQFIPSESSLGHVYATLTILKVQVRHAMPELPGEGPRGQQILRRVWRAGASAMSIVRQRNPTGREVLFGMRRSID